MRFDLAAQLVVDRLRAAGMTAAADPRDLDPPGVWVQLTDVDLTPFRQGMFKATFTLTAVVPDAGTLDALRQLGRLSDLLCAEFTTIKRGNAIGVVLPSGPDPLPGMQYTVDLVCTDDPPDAPPPPPESET